MKFQFKIQQYQTDAVNSVVNIFDGQPFQERVKYVRDLGKQEPRNQQITMFDQPDAAEDYAVGFENARLQLTSEQLTLNVRNMQGRRGCQSLSQLR
ncbi:MAG: hypothetical protein PUF71_08935 [Firmicutes bacterium]|nr:hypothetical protein [Bacillota bacterium]